MAFKWIACKVVIRRADIGAFQIIACRINTPVVIPCQILLVFNKYDAILFLQIGKLFLLITYHKYNLRYTGFL